MNWIKQNFISLMAIILSIMAICVVSFRWTPFTFDSIGFFGWVTAALSVLVMVLIGFQVWQALSINRRIKYIEKRIKKYVDVEIGDASASYMFVTLMIEARDKGKSKNYTEALYNLSMAVGKALEIRDEKLRNKKIESSLDYGHRTIYQQFIDHPDSFSAIKEEKRRKAIKAFSGVEDDRAYNLLQLVSRLPSC